MITRDLVEVRRDELLRLLGRPADYGRSFICVTAAGLAVARCPTGLRLVPIIAGPSGPPIERTTYTSAAFLAIGWNSQACKNFQVTVSHYRSAIMDGINQLEYLLDQGIDMMVSIPRVQDKTDRGRFGRQ